MKCRLMTSNIWGEYFGNPVPPRAVQLLHVFQKYRPDILGLQEAMASWQKSTLFPALAGDYEQVSVPAVGNVNHTPLFYLRERFEVVTTTRHLFHITLDESKGWTGAVFREKSTGARFGVLCTHFWWKPKPEDDVIRYYNAKDLVTEAKRLAAEYTCPVFFMGDLNCGFPSLAWEYLNQQGYDSAYRVTGDFSPFSTNHYDPKKGADGSFHGNTTAEPPERSLDHIGIPAGVTVHRQYAVTDQEALDASDHSPVLADVEF